jgi:hypothetical protein
MNIGFRSYISPSTHIINSGKNAKTHQREESRLILKSPSQKQSTNRKKRMTMNEWSSQRYNTTSFHSKPPELHDLLLGASPIITKKENQRKKKKKKNPNTTTQYFPTKKSNNNNRAWHWGWRT